MRLSQLLGRAILSVAVMCSLAPSNSAAQTSIDVAALRTHCVSQRTAALTEMFGADYNAEQSRVLDERLGQSLEGSGAAQLAEAYQAFEPNVLTARPAADRYAQCLSGARLRQLDPNADLQAVLRGDYTPPAATSAGAPAANDPWSSALTRTDQNTAAGSAVLAQSADPASRAARQRENAALRAQAEQRIAQRRAESAAFWGAVLQAAAIAAETYIQVEAAQAQAEAEAAAQAQAQADAYAQTQAQSDSYGQAPSQSPSQQTASTCGPPGTVYYYGNPNCDSSASRYTHNPANDGTNCVRVVPNPGNWGSAAYFFVNNCGWPVEVAWDRNSQGRYTSMSSIPIGGHYPTGFARLPSPFPYLACKNRPEIGADMYNNNGTHICIGPAA